ncbi:MAG: hypothetical protein WBK48_02825 [Dethiobacteria bacterium]|jgi:hypothetical protein|nr:hypothetical protein [Bacillota bacterium]
MKARLVPLYFQGKRDEEFDRQVNCIKELLKEEAEILEPVALGNPLPDADAALFPVLIGEAYRQADKIAKIDIPIVIITSEFGTVAMWDWEIITYLNAKGIETLAPYELEITKTICRALSAKRELKDTRFLVYQDNPGDGMQAEIFKRFYWWEDECTNAIEDKFGVKIIKKSWKKLSEDAKKISDAEAARAWEEWSAKTPVEGLSQQQIFSAVKMYLAVKRDLEQDSRIKGVGSNCLNESFYSDTTPCFAWTALFEEKGIMWACEADTISLITKFIVHRSLKAPVMMSNVYPFLLGMAALKHEKIDKFPEVKEPDKHLLVVHCGYMGLMPKSFATDWTLRPPVLEIVDKNAMALDARMATGAITLAKLHPSFQKIQVIKAELEKYVQYPGSDCRNGALVRVADGHKMVKKLYSHHNCLIQGDKAVELDFMSRVFALEMEEL